MLSLSKHALPRLDASARAASRWLAAFGLLLLFANALAVVADVLLRAGLNAPIDRLPDVSSVVYYIAAACCLPAAAAHRRHITIRALGGLRSAGAKEAIEAFAALLTAAVFGIIAWQIWRHTLDLAANNRTLWQIDVPIAPFWWAVTALLLLNFAIQLGVLLQHALGAARA